MQLQHDNNIVETKYRFSLNVLLGARLQSTQGTLIRVSWAKVDKTDEEEFFLKSYKKVGKNVLLCARLPSTQGTLIRVRAGRKSRCKLDKK